MFNSMISTLFMWSMIFWFKIDHELLDHCVKDSELVNLITKMQIYTFNIDLYVLLSRFIEF